VQEPDWKNPSHIARMIIVSNALKFEKQIISELPFYFNKHNDYLSDLYPEYIELDDSSMKTQKSKTFNSLLSNRCAYLLKPNTLGSPTTSLVYNNDGGDFINVDFAQYFTRIVSNSIKALVEEQNSQSINVFFYKY
jgi:hypothetical protein